MICSIDADRCVNTISILDLMQLLAWAGLLAAIGIVVFLFRELLGGLLIIFACAAILWSFGLLQVLFVLSFVPMVFYVTLVNENQAYRRWRSWPIALLIAPMLFATAVALAIFWHEEAKLLATLLNLTATVLAIVGSTQHMARQPETEGKQ